HLPLADLVENPVAVEKEAVGAAALNHRRLPHRDAALADQVLAERFDAVVAPARLLFPLAIERIDLLRREQLALHQEGAVLGDVGGRGCHRQESGVRSQGGLGEPRPSGSGWRETNPLPYGRGSPGLVHFPFALRIASTRAGSPCASSSSAAKAAAAA